MFCCVLFATLFAQPLTFLAALGARRPKLQTLSATAGRRTVSLPATAIVAEAAFVAMVGVALATRLQPGALGSFQHICRIAGAPVHW